MSLISSFDTISIGILDSEALDPNIILSIPATAAEEANVNANGTKTLLANSFSAFFVNGRANFSNGSRSLPRNSPDYNILDN